MEATLEAKPIDTALLRSKADAGLPSKVEKNRSPRSPWIWNSQIRNQGAPVQAFDLWDFLGTKDKDTGRTRQLGLVIRSPMRAARKRGGEIWPLFGSPKCTPQSARGCRLIW